MEKQSKVLLTLDELNRLAKTKLVLTYEQATYLRRYLMRCENCPIGLAAQEKAGELEFWPCDCCFQARQLVVKKLEPYNLPTKKLLTKQNKGV